MAEGLTLIRDGCFTSAFDDLVSKTMSRWNVPGLSIAVIKDDTVMAKVCPPTSPNHKDGA